MRNPKDWPKSWISAGGLLGLAIVVSRVTRTPLAVLLAAAPQLLRVMQSFERVQAQQRSNQPASSNQMTREEAALILGVGANASEQEVKDAYKRLMVKNHPDHGGSDYLAAKINQARDVLLRS